MEFVVVDGSQGEGGGQILRTAVAFSAIKKVPVRIVRIRAGRDVPGLKRQHVTSLTVLARAFSGRLEGAVEGSSEVSFVPGEPALERLEVDMGTAASIPLVLQAVIPAVALSEAKLSLRLVGGTDVPWSPTFDYFQRVATEGYRAVGISARVEAARRGYYPRGGGEVTAEVGPSGGVTSLTLVSRPAVSSTRVVSRCGRLPRRVAERQSAAAVAELSGKGIAVEQAEVSDEPSDSPGTSVLVYRAGEGVIMGSDSIGAKGKPAEDVGSEAAKGFVAAQESGGCLDANLADMVLPLLSLAAAPSLVKVPAMTSHLETGLRLASQFTGCRWMADREADGVLVAVYPENR
ncbi:MAG: RNA 3'-terminal phosphate cyclase [Nitrososphaerota archaeon]|nr:RNA 3'-terminal phosphate cyclase [Nitrososphaerota archaeon]